jgi:hypothetical protein
MIHILTDASVVVLKGDHRAEFSKKNFNTEILDDPILNVLSIEELIKIWKDLYGIPENLNDFLRKKIELYSASSDINSFFYEGKEYWLDKDNRNSLWNLSNSSLGNIEFVVGDEILNLNSLKLKSFLLKLEVYAYKCFVNTFKHQKFIKTLNTLEDILNYDYTTGYPEKITLE